MIKTIKLVDKGQTYRDDPFLKAMLQRRIDKTQTELGPLVKDCQCKKCYAEHILIYNITMLAITFNLNEIEYEIVPHHKKRNKK